MKKKLSGIQKLLIIGVVSNIALISFHVIGISKKPGITVAQATQQITTYIKNMAEENNLPITPKQLEQDQVKTVMLISQQAGSTDPDATIPLKAVYNIRQGYKDKLTLLYEKHFSTQIVSNNFITRYLARKQVKTAVKRLLHRRLGKATPQEIIDKLWKKVEHAFVKSALFKYSFLDEQSIPLIRIKDRNRLVKETKSYTKKHVLQTQRNKKRKKRRLHQRDQRHKSRKRWLR